MATSPIVATDHSKHQAFYDFVTGCSSQSSTLDCLGKASYDKYVGAVNRLPVCSPIVVSSSLLASLSTVIC